MTLTPEKQEGYSDYWTGRTGPGSTRPEGLLLSHRVPYGRIFRQWDTDGKLWVWCNRGEVADLPRGPRPNVFNDNWTTILFDSIPIYNRE